MVHGTIAYIIGHGSHTIYKYKLDSDMWNKHSECPHVNPGLIIINDILTAVGGKKGNCSTNNLVSFNHDKWMERFPPMQTPRERPAVVHYNNYVVTIGGDCEKREVELLHIPSLHWSTVTSLPSPLAYITATLCHNDIIAMDYEGSGYMINIESLISLASTEHSKWMPLPQCPVVWGGPSLTVFHGQSLVVSYDGIFQLQDREWLRIGDMSVPDYCIVCVVCDQMVAVGGHPGYPVISTDTVSVAIIV